MGYSASSSGLSRWTKLWTAEEANLKEREYSAKLTSESKNNTWLYWEKHKKKKLYALEFPFNHSPRFQVSKQTEHPHCFLPISKYNQRYEHLHCTHLIFTIYVWQFLIVILLHSCFFFTWNIWISWFYYWVLPFLIVNYWVLNHSDKYEPKIMVKFEDFWAYVSFMEDIIIQGLIFMDWNAFTS